MNARARREAMDRMDRRDYAGAQSVLRSVSASADVLFSRVSSPEVVEELKELSELSDSLLDRKRDAASRKQMAYRRENIRKGK
jgi:hypothetical protein